MHSWNFCYHVLYVRSAEHGAPKLNLLNSFMLQGHHQQKTPLYTQMAIAPNLMQLRLQHFSLLMSAMRLSL